MLTLLELRNRRTAQPIDQFNTGISQHRRTFFESQVLYLEVRIVEAVTEEVDQIRDNLFRAFTLKQLRQMVVSRRKELNKNLADNTDTRFLFIGDRNVVEIANHRAADLFEAGMA